jgi:hypothetical protein
VEEQLAFHILVAVDGYDVPRARLVRSGRQRPHERRLLDQSGDRDVLPFLDVRADANDEIGVLAEEILVGHGAIVG